MREIFRPVLFVPPLCACPLRKISLATSEKRESKSGLKLPKTDNHWNIANSYFKSTFPVSSIDTEDLNATIKCMNETIYNYFKDNYDTVETNTYKIYHEKYKEFNKHKLKRELKKLKEPEADKEEIKFVAKLLRSRLKGTEDDFYSVDHNSLAKKNI